MLEFDQFMALPACTTGTHTSEAPIVAPTASSSTSVATYIDENGKEVYGVAPKPPTDTAAEGVSAAIAPATAPVAAAATASGSAANSASLGNAELEEDDPSQSVPDGAPCKRLGCKAKWQGEAISRGSGEGSVCRYHPQAVRSAILS